MYGLLAVLIFAFVSFAQPVLEGPFVVRHELSEPFWNLRFTVNDQEQLDFFYGQGYYLPYDFETRQPLAEPTLLDGNYPFVQIGDAISCGDGWLALIYSSTEIQAHGE